MESLEGTKATAAEVAAKVAQARESEAKLGAAREVYRPVAARGALLYFMLDSLAALDRVYWYSMENFVRVLRRGMAEAAGTAAGDEAERPPGGDTGGAQAKARVEALVESTTAALYSYVSQGLFERHKLVAGVQLCFAVLRARGALPPAKLDFLLRAPQAGGRDVGPEWLTPAAWASAQALGGCVEEFNGLAQDLVASGKRWKEWAETERPEEAPLPGQLLHAATRLTCSSRIILAADQGTALLCVAFSVGTALMVMPLLRRRLEAAAPSGAAPRAARAAPRPSAPGAVRLCGRLPWPSLRHVSRVRP